MSNPESAASPSGFVSIDQFRSHVAVLDSTGTILATNTAWRRFAEANGGSLSAAGEGVNYLTVCESATNPGRVQADAFAAALRSVLDGTREGFDFEYDCHGNGQQRWFVCRVSRFSSADGPRILVSHEDVASIKRAQLDAEARSTLFETLTRESPVGIFRVDHRGDVRHFNTCFADRMSLAPAEVEGFAWWDRLHPDDRGYLLGLRREWKKEQGPAMAEVRFLHPDGSTRWVTIRVAPLPATGRGLPDLVGTIVDTTERKKMEICFRTVSVELAHLEGEALYRAAMLHLARILELEIALLAVPTGGGRAGTLAVVVDGEQAANFEYEIAGTPCEGVLESFARVYPSGVRELFPNDQVAKDMGVESYAGIALVDPGNHPIGLLVVASKQPLRESGDLPALLHLFGARLAADLERRKSEAGFRDLFDFAPDALVLCSPTGRIEQINRHAESLFGYSRDELVGQEIETLVPESWRTRHVPRRSAYLAAPEPRTMIAANRTVDARRRDGTSVPVDVSLAPIETAHGSFTIAAVRDATERLKSEHERIQRQKAVELRLSIEDVFAAQTGLSAAVTAIADHLRRALDLATIRIHIEGEDDSLPPVDARIADDPDSIPADYTSDAAAIRSMMEQGGMLHLPVEGGPAGSPSRVASKPSSVRDSAVCCLHIGDRVFGTLFVAAGHELEDETLANLATAASVVSAHLGRIAAENGLRDLASELEQRVALRTRELETANRELDAFAASVSHDLRAPIRRVHGFASLLRQSLGDRVGPEDAEALDHLITTSRDMGEIVSALLTVARIGRTSLRHRSIALNPLVDEVSREVLATVNGRRVDVHVAPLPIVSGDPTLIRQVLENLLSNAVKYTRPRDVARIAVGFDGIEDGRARIHVADNGIGFAMEDAGRLFEMFRRLDGSEAFEGTGVGLATVRRILERHGCGIRAESKPGIGTTFHFTLPAAAAHLH